MTSALRVLHRMHHLPPQTRERGPGRRATHRAGHAVCAALLGLPLVSADRRAVTLAAPPTARAVLLSVHLAGRCAEVLTGHRSTVGPWRALPAGAAPRSADPLNPDSGATSAELSAASGATLAALRRHLPALLALAARLETGETLTGEDVRQCVAEHRPAPVPSAPRSPGAGAGGAALLARLRRDILGRRLRRAA